MTAKQTFTTRIVKSAGKTGCVLPFDPNRAWGEKERHHVSGTINGCPVRGALHSVDGTYVLALGPAWLRDSHLAVGAEVQVVLSPEGPQIDNIAADVAAALAAEPQARDFFGGLPTFYRKNFMRWIESAKRPETRGARIAELIGLLKAGKRER